MDSIPLGEGKETGCDMDRKIEDRKIGYSFEPIAKPRLAERRNPCGVMDGGLFPRRKDCGAPTFAIAYPNSQLKCLTALPTNGCVRVSLITLTRFATFHRLRCR